MSIRRFSALAAAAALALCACGCEMKETGARAELVSRSWVSKESEGAGVSLDFSGDNARLVISGSQGKTEISGRFIADDSAFVVFVPELCRTYSFDYKAEGKRLRLGYEGEEIVLESGD